MTDLDIKALRATAVLRDAPLPPGPWRWTSSDGRLRSADGQVIAQLFDRDESDLREGEAFVAAVRGLDPALRQPSAEATPDDQSAETEREGLAQIVRGIWFKELGRAYIVPSQLVTLLTSTILAAGYRHRPDLERELEGARPERDAFAESHRREARYSAEHAREADAAEVECEALREAAQEVLGSFEAARVEGLADALASGDGPRLADLVQRRIMYAEPQLVAALASTQPKDPNHGR